jgi:hypothetical protein
MQDDDSSDPEVIFDFVARIADSVACPVTADLEAGYGLASEEFVDRLLRLGLSDAISKIRITMGAMCSSTPINRSHFSPMCERPRMRAAYMS